MHFDAIKVDEEYIIQSNMLTKRFQGRVTKKYIDDYGKAMCRVIITEYDGRQGPSYGDIGVGVNRFIAPIKMPKDNESSLCLLNKEDCYS